MRGRNVGAYETLNEVLISLFRDVNNIEQKAIIISEFSDIANSDMHVIDAIDIDRPKNISSIAWELSVTVGALTISVNSLVKKGYVVHSRSSRSRRVIFISPPEKGVRTYCHHKKFHEQVTDSIVKELTEEELEALVKVLTKLNTWSRSFQEDYLRRLYNYEKMVDWCYNRPDGNASGSLYTYH